ncbi:MAG TPA: vWA domain-containing protein [Candidatus Paceibacterota bacterium]
MGRLTGDMDSHLIGRGGFAFTGLRFDKLGATEYTLVTVAVDVSGSVELFEKELLSAIKLAVDACKKSPRSDNILVRVLLFSTKFQGGVSELHGFKPLTDIDVAAYPALHPSGSTPLWDAVYSSIGATNIYAELLANQDYGVNAITFVITDGANNSSTATMAMIKHELKKAISGEKLESMISILVGINSAECRTYLEEFQKEAGMTHYKDIGDATPRNLAKLAAFVSRSVSSQSQALGTGVPSKQIAATI